ncbi:MAG: cache domain-containing protein [Candidatus Cloacimonadota bacterium]|nr:cache domain-containing protein [Candidatus Cloacimonadota bacterium]
MKNLEILLLLIISMLLSSKGYSDMKPYDGEEFDLISYRLKVEKTGIPGSGYVQRKPDPLSVLTKKLVHKCMKYVGKLGLESTISLINEKPRKFRDFKTFLFIIDIKGNVLAHSGNPNFAGKNMYSTKDSRGFLFIQEYVNNIQQYEGINYMNLLTFADDTQYIYNFVYLERIDENLIIGAVAKP